MINNYKDHAANERTYLAWVRTSVTVMVMGFVIEKFGLFLATSRLFLSKGQAPVASIIGYEVVSIFLVSFGILIMLWSTLRYVRTNKAIDRGELLNFGGLLGPFVLTGLLLLFGIGLILSLARLI